MFLTHIFKDLFFSKEIAFLKNELKNDQDWTREEIKKKKQNRIREDTDEDCYNKYHKWL